MDTLIDPDNTPPDLDEIEAELLKLRALLLAMSGGLKVTDLGLDVTTAASLILKVKIEHLELALFRYLPRTIN